MNHDCIIRRINYLNQHIIAQYGDVRGDHQTPNTTQALWHTQVIKLSN